MPVTLPANPAPSQSSQRTVEHRGRSMQFGNGYRQDVVDGINSKVEKWDLVYENLNLTDRNSIIAALDAAGTWDIIWWTAPDSTAKKYKLDKSGYSERRGATTYDLRFKIEQVF